LTVVRQTTSMCDSITVFFFEIGLFCYILGIFG
jgi:hypothetical protein